MPLPLVTVTGAILKNDETPAAGWLSFILNKALVDGETEEVYHPVRTRVELDENGTFSVQLRACTGPLANEGVFYRVTQYTEGAPRNVYWRAVVPYDAEGDVDLADIIGEASSDDGPTLFATKSYVDSQVQVAPSDVPALTLEGAYAEIRELVMRFFGEMEDNPAINAQVQEVVDAMSVFDIIDEPVTSVKSAQRLMSRVLIFFSAGSIAERVALDGQIQALTDRVSALEAE